ncbi:hypothetical protein ACJJIR_05365 [Microbulbifer sp. SSSA008]|uniref:hypothetical protein n=1 Tax=Microbulbifer sp. SSSA008 TaxID=3243380 RepID=UPI00403A0B2B
MKAHLILLMTLSIVSSLAFANPLMNCSIRTKGSAGEHELIEFTENLPRNRRFNVEAYVYVFECPEGARCIQMPGVYISSEYPPGKESVRIRTNTLFCAKQFKSGAKYLISLEWHQSGHWKIVGYSKLDS